MGNLWGRLDATVRGLGIRAGIDGDKGCILRQQQGEVHAGSDPAWYPISRTIMVIRIPYMEMRRVYMEIKLPHNWQPIRTKLRMLGLKPLGHKGTGSGEEFAVTDSTKFFLMAIKYGIQYTKLD